MTSFKSTIAWVCLMLLAQTSTAQESLTGTYRLVSATRTITATGQVEDSFGKNPIGFIQYGNDGRMMVLIVRLQRPRASFGTLTDADKIALFDTMAAYGGTYDFDGKTVIHHIDVSWNGILSGTDQVRSVRADGRRLIYTNRGRSPTDGQLGVSELVWEKVEPGGGQRP
ncbi:MAG: uncharacterized protein JWQ07_4474 [Ramlibacter sp.]|nr:uncharacterized protein [Ramlibacter sp.]